MCDNLTPFVDGELSPDEAEAFRSHLVTCVPCQLGLLETMQLKARLEGLKP